MPRKNQERLWRIEGYDGSTKIFACDIRASQMTSSQVEAMLMALAAKAGLTYQEIVGAYASSRASIRNELLAVSKDSSSSRTVFMCGSNPHFSVRAIDVAASDERDEV